MLIVGMLGSLLLAEMALPAFADLKDEDLKRGSKATVLVELPNRSGFGTAFCVGDGGYFVTHRHVVAGVGVGGKVKIVVSPAEVVELHAAIGHVADDWIPPLGQLDGNTADLAAE